MPQIVLASAHHIPAVQTLWREYWDSLAFRADFQNFSVELAALPGVYAPPEGRLLLALVDEQPGGTAAFRPLPDCSARSCEAKRLYVRPQYRGWGLGRALLTRLIEEARAAGYHEMYGDTLTSMTSALQMYFQFGFTEVPPYSPNPTPGAIFLRLALRHA
jgi:putative acetyltransferase